MIQVNLFIFTYHTNGVFNSCAVFFVYLTTHKTVKLGEIDVRHQPVDFGTEFHWNVNFGIMQKDYVGPSSPVPKFGYPHIDSSMGNFIRNLMMHSTNLHKKVVYKKPRKSRKS